MEPVFKPGLYHKIFMTGRRINQDFTTEFSREKTGVFDKEYSQIFLFPPERPKKDLMKKSVQGRITLLSLWDRMLVKNT